MLLFVCLWQHYYLRVGLLFGVWALLDWFFVLGLKHLVTFAGFKIDNDGERSGQTATQTNSNSNNEMLQNRIRQSVRNMMAFTHSMMFSIWGMAFILSGFYDVESHALLYVASLGYQFYSIFGNYHEIFGRRGRGNAAVAQTSSISSSKSKSNTAHWFRTAQNVVSAALLSYSIRLVSQEMGGWKSTVLPLLVELHPKSSWHHPNKLQRRALSYHLLTRNSDIAWMLTTFIMLAEIPKAMLHLTKLLTPQPKSAPTHRSHYWSASKSSQSQAAAAVGAAAYRRERGIKIRNGNATGGSIEFGDTRGLAVVASTAYHVTLVVCGMAGGMHMLQRIVTSEALVRDWSFVAFALVQYGFTLYQFVGVVSYGIKAWLTDDRRSEPARYLPAKLSRSLNIQWLQ